MMSDPVLNPNPNSTSAGAPPLPLVSEEGASSDTGLDSTSAVSPPLSDAAAVHSDSVALAEPAQQLTRQPSLSSSSGGGAPVLPPPVALMSSAGGLASAENLNVDGTSRAGGDTGNGQPTRDHYADSSTTATNINPTATATFINITTASIPLHSIPNTHFTNNDEAEISMTDETTMAERTLVVDSLGDERGDAKGSGALTHAKAPSGSSSAPGHARGKSLQHSDPLRKREEEEGEKTMLEDEVLDLHREKARNSSEDREVEESEAGRVLEIGGEKGPSRRPSHLRLDVQGPTPTPTPWEDVEPPLGNNLKVLAEYYSPGGSTEQKFRTLQNSGTGTRPLIPKSSYYFGPPGPDSAYGTPPVGQIGVHHPREILRIERDYTGGELIQFAPIYPLELEGRLTPTQFLESINSINEILISAHSLRHSMLDHMLAIFSLQISRLFVRTHFEKEMDRLRALIEELNREMYNPVGLNILWPRDVAFLYLEIEYYDADFLALLQKQFPTTDASLFMGGYADAVNPQNISTYPLPSLTPPSEDSSPSPPGSNQDQQDPEANDYALKRKASDEDFSDDGPTQKSQNTASDKKGGNTRRKSTGSSKKGKDEGRLMKRKEQNRAAQRAFRERKEKHVKDLEDKVADLEAKNEQAVHENENLRDLLTRLQTENVALKQSSFTFALPKPTSNSIPTPVESPRTTQSLFSAVTPQSQSAPSPAASTSSKLTNPLDWSSLTSFDPAMLNLLDDTVPQPTATENAMQMDFGFGANTGLSSNAPYTTIASNPMFMSFASTFDNLSPESSSNNNNNTTTPSASGSSTNAFSAFNFDLSSIQSWPTPSSSHDTNLDDLFSSYLGHSGAMDMSLLSSSPASISPVAHHISPVALKARSPAASSSSSSSPSPLATVGSAVPTKEHHSEETCPKTKKDFEQRIVNEGPSPFAPASLRKSSDAVLGTMIACAGSNFPKTAKSDKNIEVLSAWRSIRADPKFKDADINELCSEFTSKARCDGTKVVLEPQGVHSIIESLSKKQ